MKQVYVVYWCDEENNAHGIEGVYKKEEDARQAMVAMFMNEVEDHLEDEVLETMGMVRKEKLEDYTKEDLEKICERFGGSYGNFGLRYELYEDSYSISIGAETLR